MLTDEEIQSVYSEFLDMKGSAMEFARRIERAVLAKAMAQNQSDATGRSPQDYAIEHAEYMATSAEQLLNHLNECTNIDDCVIEPDENFSDYISGLRISIHDFRKRRDRAKAMQKQEHEENPHEWIIERLSYHKLERQDLSIDDCLKYLESEWKEVYGRTTRQLIMQILSLLAAPQPAQAAAIPEGWQLVPVDPNSWMCATANDATGGKVGYNNIEKIYKAMLSASPKPE